ncbi:MAG: FliH/SctL family protein [Dissulfurispiraceae bacterium]
MEKKLLFSSPEAQPYALQEFYDETAGGIRRQNAAGKGQLSEEEHLRMLEQEAGKKGYKEGHAEGFTKGLDGGKDEVNSSLKRLGEIIVSLSQFRENKLNELLPDIMDLSLEIAKKIVHKEIDLDRNLILSVAQDAIRKVAENEEGVVIKVNPLDYEVMIPHIDLLKEQSGLKNIAIEPSTSVSPGGCYIETQTGEVDARLEEQIKEVEDVIGTAIHRKM